MMKQNESIFLSDTAEICATQSYKCEVNLKQRAHISPKKALLKIYNTKTKAFYKFQLKNQS